MSAKFTVVLRIAAGQASFQTLVAVAIFVLFTIKYTLSFRMIAAVTFIYHGERTLLQKYLGVKDRAHWVRRMGHRAKDPYMLCPHTRRKDGAILQDHFGKFVYNAFKLVSVHPETMFLDVILRSKATKNPIVGVAAEILRSAQNDIREFPDRHSNWKEHYSATWEK
jgi:hypothetical protein